MLQIHKEKCCSGEPVHFACECQTPGHPMGSCTALTFSPLGPESPLRPGKPGGPFGRQEGKQRGEWIHAKSLLPSQTLIQIWWFGHTSGPGGPSGPGDPGRPCSPCKTVQSSQSHRSQQYCSQMIMNPPSSGHYARRYLPCSLADKGKNTSINISSGKVASELNGTLLQRVQADPTLSKTRWVMVSITMLFPLRMFHLLSGT